LTVVSHLLHLGQLEGEKAVDPVQQLGAPHEERGVLQPDGGGARHRGALYKKRGAGVYGPGMG